MIWQLKVQQRIRTFLWLLSHGKLLSNFSHWKRRIADSPESNMCIESEKTNLHTVRDCSEAKNVWLHLIPPCFVQKLFSLLIKEWILWNLSIGSLQRSIQTGRESSLQLIGLYGAGGTNPSLSMRRWMRQLMLSVSSKASKKQSRLSTRQHQAFPKGSSPADPTG